MHVDLGRILHLTCIYVTLIELNGFPAPPPASLGQPRLLGTHCFLLHLRRSPAHTRFFYHD